MSFFSLFKHDHNTALIATCLHDPVDLKSIWPNQIMVHLSANAFQYSAPRSAKIHREALRVKKVMFFAKLSYVF